jgi:hypothetical protein
LNQVDIHHYYIDDNLNKINKKTRRIINKGIMIFIPCKRIQNPDWLNVSSVVNVRWREFFSLNKEAPNGSVPDKDKDFDDDK